MTVTRPLFHHADAGTGEPEWLADPRWDATTLVDLDALRDRYDDLLVLAAHPDDESLAVGGLVAAAHRRGVRVRVLVATAGEASHPHATAWSPDLLARIRRDEVVAAVAALAPGAPVDQLEHPDGGLGRVLDDLAGAVAARSGPRTLVVAPWTADGHPDHDAAGAAALAGARTSGAAVAHYPLWLWHWGHPDDLPWDLARVVEPSPDDVRAKESALAAHPSQTRPLGPGRGDAPVVTDPVLRRAVRPFEVLIAQPGVLPVRVPRADAGVADPFDAMYDEGADPWGFRGSFYERRKRDLTAALLRRERYGRVLEIGCATGELTRVLASRADAVVALDVSVRALDVAREGAPHTVEWVLGRAPAAVPQGPFDLVVVSEVGYFLTPLELLATLRAVRERLVPGGEVVLVHWRHGTRDVPLDGPLVHRLALAALGDLGSTAHYDDADLLVDVLGGAVSLAADEGRA